MLWIRKLRAGVKKGTGLTQFNYTRLSGTTQNRDTTEESSCTNLSKHLRHTEETEIHPLTTPFFQHTVTEHWPCHTPA